MHSGEGGRTASVVHRGIARGFSEEVRLMPSSEAGAGVHSENDARTPLLGRGVGKCTESGGTLNPPAFPELRVRERGYLQD